MSSSFTAQFCRLPSEEASGSQADTSDQVLLSRVCVGDMEALACLFQRYARLVRSISCRILRDRAEADDLLQEIFLFIYRKSEMFDSSKSSVRSWIVQMTYHRAIDQRRYLQSRHFYTRIDLNGAANLPSARTKGRGEHNPFDHLAGSVTIQGLLATLTEDQRDTLKLHFFEGFTFNEIAMKMDQSLGNIRNHYYRGLDKLRKQMCPGKLPGRNAYGGK